ncbi:hypothetical protein [Propionispora vibrioides]|uniref:DUF2577 domain-containing protein n=1 Tax=Propionispora vibrioides TaxID=112903 RepID=A0A1H8U7Q5_9FIRM|nr:hypothetical protein [Propionispora vibrioides]SEO98688.1 hypothetical protein SAMN04490178_10848 [Propionispora vibrioides]
MPDDPFSELFGMLHNQMKERAQAAIDGNWVTAELGTMTDNMGLKLDRFKYVIDDYLLSHHLTLAEPYMTQTEVDGHHADPIGGTHSHQVITPPQLLPLHPGDRVLAVPVNGGQDFVIVARVVPRG